MGTTGPMRLRPDRWLWSSVDGTVVAGGSPWRLSRLAPRAAEVVRLLRQADASEAQGVDDEAVATVLVERGFAHPVHESRPGPHPVDVVVPAFGRADALDRCLAHLIGLNVTVVDDGTPEPSPVGSCATRHGMTWIRLDTNQGPAAARNAGAATGRSPILAFVDSDCRPAEGWLDRLVPHFDDPRVVAVAPRIVPGADDKRLLVRFERECSALDMGPYPALVRPGARLGFLPSATLLVRRTSFDALRFDEELRLGEDVDLVWRLADSGGHVRYEPGAVVEHDPPASWTQWLSRRFDYGTSAKALEDRHPGRLTPVHVSGWNAATLALVCAGRPLLAGATAATAGALLARRLRAEGIGADVALLMLGRGLAADAVGVGHALRREYWPLGAAALLLSPVSRPARIGAATMVLPLLSEWVRERPAIDPLRYIGLRLVADAAYGTGVLTACVRNGDVSPLVPRLRRRERRLTTRRRSPRPSAPSPA